MAADDPADDPADGLPTVRGPVAVVTGTRPEIVKLAGVVRLLGPAAFVVHTGQHWDDEMAGAFLRDLGIGRPQQELAVGGRSRGEQIGLATDGLARVLAALGPTAVVVQGDTNSALAGGLAANATELPLVHVEAGLRSHDRRMPEEHNRVLIDHLSDLCCAPTEVAAANLRAEGVPAKRVEITGNTVVEAVRRLLPGAEARARLLAGHGLTSGAFVLATLHRPENTTPAVLQAVLKVLADLPVPVVLPLHPRTASVARDAGLTPLLDRLRTVPPLPYETFLALLGECCLCVSDSGGIQEEVTVLGRPVVVVRRSTERPEVLGTWATLVAPGPRLGPVVRRALVELPAITSRLQGRPSPYGDGTAAARTVAAIARRQAKGWAVGLPLEPAGTDWWVEEAPPPRNA